MPGLDNPHAGDPDRAAIWEMLMVRDNLAFAAADWDMVAGDFVSEGFVSVHAQHDADPDNWQPVYASLEDYRRDWLKQAAETAAVIDMESFAERMLGVASIKQIDINGGMALAHKKFDGELARKDAGPPERLNWQTLYICRKVGDGWRIAGFVGYMPRPLCAPAGG